MNGRERRQSARVDLAILLTIQTLEIPKSAALMGLTENISATGVYLASDSPFEMGTRLEISLRMPEIVMGKPACEWCCRGRVLRVQHRAMVRLTSDKIEVRGETLDISLNGMLAEAARCVPSGSQVEVSLELSPGSKPIVGLAMVMRTMGENQMGIEFSQLNKIESSRLQESLLPLIDKD
jgi:c-di-GMP-binding flagellar brake protein YcgR